MSSFEPFQLVFIDESGCDERLGLRKCCWSPIGTTPEETVSAERGEKIHILPAYTIDGVITAEVYAGFTDEDRFFKWLEEKVIPLCQPYPGPRSVLIMDNASFHRSDRISSLCEQAGVKLIYLPPYSPDVNPIEEFFGQLKVTVRRHWDLWQSSVYVAFKDYIVECVRIVGADKEAAKGHFKNCYIDGE
ncbi:Hypothetical protein D9617_72g012010 [Elsinoe fawcettii]|nr:Hypothetical protein D9617_72g012010 [Elsinoe fawcettii]